MASTDIAPVIARLKAVIETVPNIGLVYPYPLYNRDDLGSLLVSEIGRVRTLRAWAIVGPTMAGRNMVQRPGGHIERTWTYTIHGYEGLSADGDSIVTVQANALAICDVIDVDPDLNGTVHRSQPCSWTLGPQNLISWHGIALSTVQIVKQVTTLSTP